MSGVCDVCSDDFDDERPENIPTLLVPCGHSLCHQCSTKIWMCPVCRKRVDNRVVNYALKERIASDKLHEKVIAKVLPQMGKQTSREMKETESLTQSQSQSQLQTSANQSGNASDNAMDTSMNSNIGAKSSTRSSRKRAQSHISITTMNAALSPSIGSASSPALSPSAANASARSTRKSKGRSRSKTKRGEESEDTAMNLDRHTPISSAVDTLGNSLLTMHSQSLSSSTSSSSAAFSSSSSLAGGDSFLSPRPKRRKFDVESELQQLWQPQVEWCTECASLDSECIANDSADASSSAASSASAGASSSSSLSSSSEKGGPSIARRHVEYYCEQCDGSFCKQCDIFIHRRALAHHRRVPINERPRDLEPRCPLHHERQRLFCVPCRSLVCILCVHSKEHAAHAIQCQLISDLRDDAEKKMSGILKEAKDTSDMLTHWESAKRKKIDHAFEDFCADIEAECAKLHAEIDAFKVLRKAEAKAVIEDSAKQFAEFTQQDLAKVGGELKIIEKNITQGIFDSESKESNALNTSAVNATAMAASRGSSSSSASASASVSSSSLGSASSPAPSGMSFSGLPASVLVRLCHDSESRLLQARTHLQQGFTSLMAANRNRSRNTPQHTQTHSQAQTQSNQQVGVAEGIVDSMNLNRTLVMAELRSLLNKIRVRVSISIPPPQHICELPSTTLSGEVLLRFGQRGNGDRQFNQPGGILSHNNLIYIADNGNRRIQVYQMNGLPLSQSATMDLVKSIPVKNADDVRFLAIDDDLIYVTDSMSNSIHVITMDGTYVRRIGTTGNTQGGIEKPRGICVRDGEIFVGVSGSHHRIVVFSLDGKFLREIEKTIHDQPFNCPCSLFIDANDVLWVTDHNNGLVHSFSLDGKPLAAFGSPAELSRPIGVYVDTNYVYIVCADSRRIGVYTKSGEKVKYIKSEQNAWGFDWPYSITMLNGFLFVTDFGSNEIFVLR